MLVRAQTLTTKWINHALFLSLIATTMVACLEPFRVISRSTQDFPETWEERLQRLRNGENRPVAHHSKSPTVYRKTSESLSSGAPPPLPDFNGDVERLAVLELVNRAPQQVSRDEVSYLTNELRTVASYLPSPKYLVLTQESLEALIDPSMKLEDCVGSCAVETGRIVGARWILTGEVVRFGSSLRVSLKLHDTQSGHFLKGAAVKGKSVEELEQDLHTQALSLVKEVSPKWGKWLDRVAPHDLPKQLKHLRRSTN